jgi:protein kinase A
MHALGFLRRKRTRDGNPGHSSSSNPTSPVSSTAGSFDHGAVPRGSRSSAASSQSTTNRSSGTAAQLNKPAEAVAEQQQQPMNTLTAQPPYTAAPVQHTPSPGTDPQKGPHISNLINPPQESGYQHHQGAGQYTSNGGAPSNQPQHQQQQHQNQHQQQTQVAAAAAQLSEARVTKGKYSLADFELLRTLGTGSFGRVHLVQSRHNHRFYAIKVLKKAQVVKMKQVEHTNDERKMLGEVKHPFLITLWGTFQDPRNLYMVMDFVEGGELFSLLRRSGVSFSRGLLS